MLTIAGCDCGKDTLYVCIADAKPRNLKDFARSYKPLILKADREGIETLLALPVRAYAIEPTGDYSRIWVEHLKRNNREILIVSPRRVRHFAEYHDLTNKADNPEFGPDRKSKDSSINQYLSIRA